MTVSLEDQATRLRIRIDDLEGQLKDVETRLHRKRLRESGLIGRTASSSRVPNGIVIEDITFHTWAPTEPQSVSGYRVNTQTWTTIHLTSPGYQLHDTDSTSSAA